MSSRLHIWVALSLLFAIHSMVNPTYSQENQNITFSGETSFSWGGTRDIVVREDLAIVATDETGVRFVDVSDPTSPVEISAYDTPGSAQRICLQDNLLYVSDGIGGIRILDIQDVLHPVEIGNYTGTTTARQITLGEDNLIYVANSLSGLLALDISDPTNPQLAGSYDIPGDFYSVDYHDGYLYAGVSSEPVTREGGGIRIFRVIGGTFLETGFIPVPGEGCHKVVVRDTLAFAACYRWGYPGLRIFDVRDPSNPGLISVLDIEAFDLTLQDDNAFVTGDNTELSIVDISNPVSPDLLSSLTCNRPYHAITVQNNHAYIASMPGLDIIDVEDPENPNWVGIRDGYGGISRSDTDGNLVHVVSSELYYNIDISDPTEPRLTGTFKPEGWGGISAIISDGDHVYASPSLLAEIVTLDVSDPENPSLSGEYELNPLLQYTWSLSLYEGKLYASLNNGYLQRINISNPDSLSLECEGYVDLNLQELTFTSTYLYCISDGILLVIDYRREDEFREVNDDCYSFSHYGLPKSLAANEDYLFMGVYADDSPVLVYGLSDPLRPELLTVLDSMPDAEIVRLNGNYLYIADKTAGLFIYNVSDVWNPILTGHHSTRSNPVELDIQGNNTIITFRNYIGIYDCSEAIHPTEVTVPLQGNYLELVSFPLQPQQTAVDILFGSIENLEIVYQNDGRVYVPGIFNTIDQVDVTQGYRVFCNSDDIWTYPGTSFDQSPTITLEEGRWNWMGYPFQYAIPVGIALQEIADHVVILVNDSGGLWIPAMNINTLGVMRPGEGYYTFVDQDLTFQYQAQEGVALASVPASGNGSDAWEIPEVEGAPEPTGLPYAVLVRLSDEVLAQEPAVIEVYDGDLLVGKSLVSGDLSGNVGGGTGFQPVDHGQDGHATSPMSGGLLYSSKPVSPTGGTPSPPRQWDRKTYAWIPACAGMTRGVVPSLQGNIPPKEQENEGNKDHLNDGQERKSPPLSSQRRRGSRKNKILERNQSTFTSMNLNSGSMLVPVIAWGGAEEYGVAGFTPGHPITVQALASDGELLAEVNTGRSSLPSTDVYIPTVDRGNEIKSEDSVNPGLVFGEGPYAEIFLASVDETASASPALPDEFAVESAYPNPFNPSVTIPFTLPKSGEVNFAVFNILGQRLFSRTQTFQAGTHSFLFDASITRGTGTTGSGTSSGNLVSGVYFLQVQFNGQVNTQKIVLLR